MKPGWMIVALEELGVHEIAGLVNTERILEYHSHTLLRATTDEVPWCSAFLCFCIDKTGRTSTKSAAALSWRAFGLTALLGYGVIVVLSRGIVGSGAAHVGFCVDYNDTHVWLLCGNQGDAVRIAKFPRVRILDVRLPAV